MSQQGVDSSPDDNINSHGEGVPSIPNDFILHGHEMMANMYGYYQSMMQHANQPNTVQHGGTSSRRRHIRRDRECANNRLMADYFVDRLLYSSSEFTRRFCMRRELFLKIIEDIMQYDTYFVQKSDAVRRQGFSPYVKMVAALHMLVYRFPADANDGYLKIAESTSLEAMKKFCRAINALYEREYLCRPNPADLVRLLNKANERGFPGMLGSLDCMHWEWKNCPTAWARTYAGHHGRPTIILEAVASYDTWIWHSFFGTPGAQNDLNVLYSSPVFSDVLEGRTLRIRYNINDREYRHGYYLADGIYPRWSNIVQSYPAAQERDKMLFNRLQQAYRKDVERAFGILQSQFEIIKGPCRLWHEDDISEIMKTCIILHNMIVEDTWEEEGDDYNDDPARYNVEEPHVHLNRDPLTINEYLNNRLQMRDASAHFALRNDLVQHIWNEYRIGNINV